jgi:hypothetical protein
MPKKFDPTPYRSKVGKRVRHFDRTAYKSKITRFKNEDPRGQYERAAYRALGLPVERKADAVYHHLGDVYVTSSPEAMTAMVQVYLSTEKDAERVYTFQEYLDAYQRRGKILSQIEAIEKHEYTEEVRYQEFQDKLNAWSERDLEKQGPQPQFYERMAPKSVGARDRAFVEMFSLEIHTPDIAGYEGYLQFVAPKLLHRMYEPLPLYVEENPDRPHGYILGTPGSGKSELLKLLVHTFVTNRRYGSVVVIDPTSEFVGQIARWKEFNTSDRLIYVRPTLAKGKSPCINPFEIHGVEAMDYSEEALNVKRVVAQELVEALGRIVAEAGGFVTAPMRTILTNCILVLLDKEGATLEDLSDFMKDSKSGRLIAFAQTLNHHEYIAEYFISTDGGFRSKGNAMTKDAIGRRMDDLLSVGVFRKMTCGRSTIDLEREVNRKKVLLFDLGKGAIGKREGAALGRLIIAMLIGMAFRREGMKKGERVPCSIVVDECHNVMSETMEDILTEARKYRLLLTMAQQIAGQKMQPSLRDVVLATTNMQVVGGTSMSGAKRNAEIVGVSPEDIRKLSIGEFYIRANRSGEPVKFRARSDLLDWSNSVTAPTWKRTVQDQIERYYSRPVVEEENEPEVEYEGDTWTIETD